MMEGHLWLKHQSVVVFVRNCVVAIESKINSWLM